ncbi:hypothetical protein BH23ACT6_BH23ACT6_09630 [soil metagenome]
MAHAAVHGAHPSGVSLAYETALTGSRVISRVVDVRGQRVHVLESGSGPPVLLLHGTLSPSPFWLPLLNVLPSVHAFAVDRPGQGRSDPIDLATARRSDSAVSWVEGVMDALDLRAATIVGHSMGGLWALRLAQAHPERVDRVCVIGAPALPGTQAPWPFRVLATPGLGWAASRIPPSEKAVRGFASAIGEAAGIDHHPELIALMIAVGRDRLAQQTGRAEVRCIVSPRALLSRSGFKREAMMSASELRGIRVPGLYVCGADDPVGGAVSVRRICEMTRGSDFALVPGGHVPWLGDAHAVAAPMLRWMSGSASAS